MSDYLSSIKSIDEQGTSSKMSNLESIQVIDKKSEISAITSSGEELIQIENDDLAPYMKPQKVIVRKYRLKK